MQWAYKVIDLSNLRNLPPIDYEPEIMLRFDLEGEAGWELVSVDGDVAYFKRQLPPPETRKFIEALELDIAQKNKLIQARDETPE